MKIKTSELKGIALDWAVTSIEKPGALRCGVSTWRDAWRYSPINGCYPYRWHQNWSQGGPIIEGEQLDITSDNLRPTEMRWQADNAQDVAEFGPTPLIAAMRCYVASKFGDEVDVPDELMP